MYHGRCAVRRLKRKRLFSSMNHEEETKGKKRDDALLLKLEPCADWGILT